MGDDSCTERASTADVGTPVQEPERVGNRRRRQAITKRWHSFARRVKPTTNALSAAHIVERCRKWRHELRFDLAEMVRAGDRTGAKRLRRFYLKHPAVLVACLFEALKDCGEVVAHGSAWNSLRVIEEALRINVFLPTEEWVTYRPEAKPHGGGERIVFRFGPFEKARQNIAKDVADALLIPHPQSFERNGGVEPLMEWLLPRVKDAGVVMTTDYPNCFYALDRERVGVHLPLPRRVQENVLYAPAMRAKPGVLKHADMVTTEDYLHDAGCFGVWDGTDLVPDFAPLQSIGSSALSASVAGGVPTTVLPFMTKGAPPGSALAPIAAEAVLVQQIDVVEAAAPGVLVGMFMDNVIILAPDQSAAEAALFALYAWAREYFGEDVEQELRRRLRRRDPKSGIEFLGDFLQYTRGRMVRRVPEANLIDLSTETHSRILAAIDARDRSELTRIMRSIEGKAWARRYDRRAFKVAAQLLADVGGAIEALEREPAKETTAA